MKRKRIAVTVAIALSILFGIRVYMVNRDIQLPAVQTYHKGEVVPFGEDFTNSSEDNSNGYTIRVVDYELLSSDDFYEAYELNESVDSVDRIMMEYFCLVRVIIGNEGKGEEADTARGIELLQIPLVGKNYYMIMNEMIFQMLNTDMPGSSFSLRPGTSKELLLPYAAVPGTHLDYRSLEKNPPELKITEYPNRKKIALV